MVVNSIEKRWLELPVFTPKTPIFCGIHAAFLAFLSVIAPFRAKAREN